MVNLIAGVLLLITFIGLIAYCAKGGNLLVGFIVTALLWCIIGRVPVTTVVNDVFEKSVESYGATIAITYDAKYRTFAIVATVVSVLVMAVYIVFNYTRQRKNRAFAAAPKVEAKPLPWYCITVPFIPIVMVSFFSWQPVPSFLLGIFLGLLFTRNLTSYSKAVEKVQKTLYDGVADSGLLIGMLYGVNIFQAAAKQVAPILQDLLGDIIPTSPVVLLVAFCVLAPLALFRGPLMIWGSGIALASILQAMGVFTEPYLFMLFLVPPVAIVASSCPTQSWTMWALSYAKLEPKNYIKANLPWGWIACIIIQIAGYLMYSIV